MSVPALGGAINIEKQGPEIPLGPYILCQATMSRQNHFKSGRKGGRFGVTVSNTGNVVLANELNKVSNKVKIIYATKFKPDWNKVCEAVKHRSLSKFVQALMPGLEITAKGKKGFRLGEHFFTFQGGLDFKSLPIMFRTYYSNQSLRSVNARYILTLHFGLSSAGWAFVAQRIGPEAVKHFFLSQGFTRMATVALGDLSFAVATGTISFGILALTALYASHRAQQGVFAGLAATYVSAYYRKITLAGVVDGTRKRAEEIKNEYINDNKALRDKIVDAAISDAIKDAKSYLRTSNIKNANPNDEIELMGSWCQALRIKYKTKNEFAFKQALDKELTKRAMTILKR